jgi:hypothetical protein
VNPRSHDFQRTNKRVSEPRKEISVDTFSGNGNRGCFPAQFFTILFFPYLKRILFLEGGAGPQVGKEPNRGAPSPDFRTWEDCQVVPRASAAPQVLAENNPPLMHNDLCQGAKLMPFGEAMRNIIVTIPENAAIPSKNLLSTRTFAP